MLSPVPPPPEPPVPEAVAEPPLPPLVDVSVVMPVPLKDELLPLTFEAPPAPRLSP